MADEAFTGFVTARGADLTRVAYLLCRDRARAVTAVLDKRR